MAAAKKSLSAHEHLVLSEQLQGMRAALNRLREQLAPIYGADSDPVVTALRAEKAVASVGLALGEKAQRERPADARQMKIAYAAKRTLRVHRRSDARAAAASAPERPPEPHVWRPDTSRGLPTLSDELRRLYPHGRPTLDEVLREHPELGPRIAARVAAESERGWR